MSPVPLSCTSEGLSLIHIYMSDPITVDLVSQKGVTIKNNGNDVDAKAVLYRGGEEIDTGGTAYTLSLIHISWTASV